MNHNTTKNSNNFCIIMAGGSGNRFWPLSNTYRAKQFLDLLGTGETLLQNSFRHYSAVCQKENIIIVTTTDLEQQVREQLPGLLPHQVLCEPQRRGTAPCVALAASIIDNINPHANIIVAPSDHAIFNEDTFREDMVQALDTANSHDWIVTLGARPVNPNTKYGYIQFNPSPATTHTPNLHKVVTFTEKPPMDMAIKFIASGEFLWNSGIFVWSLNTLKQAYLTHLPAIAHNFFGLHGDTSPETLAELYAGTDSISVDHGIMEKASNVYCLRDSFGWSDVETWDALYSTQPKDAQGNSTISGQALFYDSEDNLVHLPAGKTAIVNGLQGFLVVESDGVLLISPRQNEDMHIKFSSDVAVLKNQQ